MSPLVLLACGLPGDPELGGDLWPPDAQVDGVVDEHRELRLCLVPHVSGVLDLLKHLGADEWVPVAPSLPVLLAPAATAAVARA